MESATRAQDGIEVSLVALEPAIVRAGQNVTMQVTLTNHTREVASAVEVAVTLQRSTPISRTALVKWTQVPHSAPSAGSLTETLSVSLPVGASATRTLTIPAAALPVVDATSWGPRGLEISARDRAGDASGSLRTWLVFAAPEQTTALPFTSVVTLAPSTRELATSLADDDAVEALRTTATPRMVALAESLASPVTTFAVDPLLLTPSDEAPAGTLNEALNSAAHTPILLPAGNADLAALAHANEPHLLELSVQDGRGLAETAGVTVRSDVLVTPGRVDAATIRATRTAGLTSMLGSASLTQILDVPAWTPSARVDVPLQASTEVADGGGSDKAEMVSVPSVLADTDLTSVIAGVPPTLGPAEVSANRLTPLQARQLSLAMTAVIQRERPNDPRALAVLLDPNHLSNPNAAETAASCLHALAHAPWLTATALGDMLDEDTEVRIQRGATLRESAPNDTELSSKNVTTLSRLLRDIDQLSEATSDPEAVTTQPLRRTQMVLALPWRDSTRTRSNQVLALRSYLGDVPRQVYIAPSSTINMLSTSADLPVRVTNELPVAIRAEVTLVPPDARLSAKESVALTVPARGEATALVPVEARGSGNFQLHATLATPSGMKLGEPALIDVRLRAEWEGRTAVVGGVALAGVVLIGIVRTARRSRRARAEAAPNASDAV